jgi:hypothetical protein
MRWEDLPLKAQKDYAKFKGDVAPEIIKKFLDRLDRDAESWVKAVYKEFTGKTPTQKQLDATKPKQRTQRTKATNGRKAR